MANDEEATQNLILHSILKQKFSKLERTFYLKQATLMQGLEQNNFGFTPLTNLFMSTNQNFYMFQAPAEPGFETLSELIARGTSPISIDVIQKFMFETLTTLHFLHNKGIAHLDLQPNNLLVYSK